MFQIVSGLGAVAAITFESIQSAIEGPSDPQ
jgi:hypothetical protein